MGWIRYGGKILKNGDKVAISDSCCCGCGCACPELQDRWHAGHQLKLTISGAITWGPCNWPILGTLPILCDTGWGPFNADGCEPIIDECIGLNLNKVWLYCPTENGTSLNDVICEASLSNMGCNFTDGDRTPLLGGEVARTPTAILCNPASIPSFYAKYVFPLEGSCGDCPTPVQVVFEWESFGPLP